MQKDNPLSPVACCYEAPRSPRRRLSFGSDAITPTPPNGFALAARLPVVLSGHVAFAEQSSLVLARATEIQAQLGEELASVEPGNPTNGVSLALNS